MPELINLYPLFVEGVFGGLLMAGIGIGIIYLIIGMIAKLSPISIIAILFAYVMAYGIGYVGMLVAVPSFILGFTYFWFAIYDWISKR